MELRGETVLVTGAAGFIGSHLVEALVRGGSRVRAVVHYNSRNDIGNLRFLEHDLRQQIDIRPIDITDAFAVRAAVQDCSCVFHLAALIGIPYSYTAPASYVEANVRGTLNVLEAVRLNGTPRLVHTSTSEAYGTAQYTPIDEAHPLQAQSPYSASKIAADKLAESYHCSYKLPVSTLRPFNTYGPRQSARAVIPTIITQLLESQGVIHLGNTAPIRDFTFVKDTVRAFLAVAEGADTIGIVCNSASGKGITIGELAHKIANLMNLRAEIICNNERVRPRDSEVNQLIGSANRLKNLTGWTPQVSLDEGLTRTLEFVNRNRSVFDKRVHSYVV